MRATLWKTAVAGLLTIGSARMGLDTASAHAQGFGSSGWDGDNYGGGYCGNGGLPSYNPNLPYSPAQQQGWHEGQLYYETGITPNHPLSPAEARGFVAGRAARGELPWQLDPAKQRGWPRGRSLGDRPVVRTGRCRRPSMQGFIAGERRAASGGDRPW